MYGRQGKPYCDACKVVAKKTNKELDSEDCSNRPPEISYELNILLDCFIICDTQLKAGMGGAYALDFSIITKVAETFGIETDKTFYKLLKAFEGTLLKNVNKK